MSVDVARERGQIAGGSVSKLHCRMLGSPAASCNRPPSRRACHNPGVHLSSVQLNRRQQHLSAPVIATYAAAGDQAFGDSSQGSEGNKDVQESLVDVLQLELAKAKIKEDIMKDLEIRKEQMKLIGQELQEDFEKEVELDRLRLELASNASLADTMAQFKELDDEIQGIRDQLHADQADLEAFEARSAASRNDSLFFKQLYRGPGTQKEGPAGSATATSASADNPLYDKQAVQQLTQNIKSPAVQEVHSPLRLYVSSYLTVALLAVIISDVSGGSPAVGLDALYAVLAAGLGWNAWQERQALIQDAINSKHN